MAVNNAALALEGNDPRDVVAKGIPLETMLLHNIHNPSVEFEEYLYWATITRADEKEAHARMTASDGPKTFKSIIANRFSKGKTGFDHSVALTGAPGPNEKSVAGDSSPREGGRTYVSDDEWRRASRATRTAGWSAIFYLITTDILGPFSVPWAFAQMGYGPGVALYTVFGALALYSGFQIYSVFIHMDSDKYPMKTFGDLFFRIYGQWARHFVNICQAIQLLFTVSILILSNGQAISQISKGKVCFVACLIIFMAAGFVVGQIRTLQRFGWLANMAVWINVLILIFTMACAANFAPNYQAVEASFGPTFAEGPIHRYAGTPPAGAATGGSGFAGSMNGLNQAVYSYGGAMLFVSFLSEMRHPWDFWKGLLCADIFIYVVYMFFGLFVYSYQGQYSFNPAMQGISAYGWQTACNIMNIVTGLIAATLYGNIGIKVAYVEVVQEIFGAPPLTQLSGKLLWIGMVPVYWALAFIVGAAIPQFSSISSLVGALCILQFTYTFPAIMAFGFQIQKDAMTPEEHFDPETRVYNRIDSGVRRWVRGFKVKWWLNSWNFFYFLGALVTSGLGCYSAIEGIIAGFAGGSAATSFGCTPPV